MRCPYCGHEDSKVTDSREAESGIRRRRQCRGCGVRFTTYERIQPTFLVVRKRDSRREEFNREKLLSGVRKACAKRPVPSRTIEKMVEDVAAELQHLGRVEVPTTIIGEMVMDRLKGLDRVAYVRYASVYRDFQDIESFEKMVKDLRDSNLQMGLPEMAPGQFKLRGRRRMGPTVNFRPMNLGTDGNNNHKGG